jgi:hypothetical protein
MVQRSERVWIYSSGKWPGCIHLSLQHQSNGIQISKNGGSGTFNIKKGQKGQGAINLPVT